MLQNVAAANAASNNPSKFQQCIAEGDLEFVSFQNLHLRLQYKLLSQFFALIILEQKSKNILCESKEIIFSLKLLKDILLKMGFLPNFIV